MPTLVPDYRMKFPPLSPEYGLCPKSARVEPEELITTEGKRKRLHWPLRVEGEVILDFGRNLTGKIWIEADGPLEIIYASDMDQLQCLLETPEDQRKKYDIHDVYVGAYPSGVVQPNAQGAASHSDEMSVLRLLYLRTTSSVTVRRCWLDFSAPHIPLDGAFQCSNAELDLVWQMGSYTTLLCTQQNTLSLDGVPAPGKGFVIWDAPRRDREVWAGDLRLSSLSWMAAYADPEPVRNSLYMIWQARHLGCADSGLIPGSGSSHQIFYEWSFWFLVNAWEYYLWSGDKGIIRALMAPGGLEETLRWVLRKGNEDGLVEAENSWMYTLRIRGEMSTLALAQVAGLEAMAQLFIAGGKPALAHQASEAAIAIRAKISAKFFDPTIGAMRLLASHPDHAPRYPLCANAIAALLRIGEERIWRACLNSITSPEFITNAGLRNFWPAFDPADPSWNINPATQWMHNDKVWPFPNCYAAWALFEAGKTTAACDVLLRFHRPHIQQGHTTIWEVMMPDGSTPIRQHGNLGSLTHAWGALGNYLLQRYVLGIRNLAPGFREVSVQPDLGELTHASGRVPTPHGCIEVELQKVGGKLRGQVTLPTGIMVNESTEGVNVIHAKAG